MGLTAICPGRLDKKDNVSTLKNNFLLFTLLISWTNLSHIIKAFKINRFLINTSYRVLTSYGWWNNVEDRNRIAYLFFFFYYIFWCWRYFTTHNVMALWEIQERLGFFSATFLYIFMCLKLVMNWWKLIKICSTNVFINHLGKSNLYFCFAVCNFIWIIKFLGY